MQISTSDPLLAILILKLPRAAKCNSLGCYELGKKASGLTYILFRPAAA